MEEYTNRELGILLEEIKRQVTDMKNENITSHQELNINQRSTNGRVKKLELWKSFLIGAWAVLSMATPIAWYLIIQTLHDFSESIDAKIELRLQQSINDAIEKNNDKYFEKEVNEK